MVTIYVKNSITDDMSKSLHNSPDYYLLLLLMPRYSCDIFTTDFAMP